MHNRESRATCEFAGERGLASSSRPDYCDTPHSSNVCTGSLWQLEHEFKGLLLVMCHRPRRAFSIESRQVRWDPHAEHSKGQSHCRHSTSGRGEGVHGRPIDRPRARSFVSTSFHRVERHGGLFGPRMLHWSSVRQRSLDRCPGEFANELEERPTCALRPQVVGQGKRWSSRLRTPRRRDPNRERYGRTNMIRQCASSQVLQPVIT